MAFKLKFQGKSKELYGSDNTMVRKGLVTPTYLMEGPGDVKKEEGDQAKADNQAAEQAKNNMKVVKTETRKVDGGTETTEFLEGQGKGKTFKEAGVDPAAGQAYWDANPKKYQEYLASKKLKDQKVTFVPDEKKPEIDYSYLDGATFGSGYQSGDFTTYGLQLMSKVGDDDPRNISQQRKDEDPMSRYLTQKELDYLKGTGRLKGNYKSGYDEYYSGMNPESKGFKNAVERGLITQDGITIPLNPMKANLESSKNLLAETGLK